MIKEAQIITVHESEKFIGYVEQYIHEIMRLTQNKNRAYKYTCSSFSFATCIVDLLREQFTDRDYRFTVERVLYNEAEANDYKKCG